MKIAMSSRSGACGELNCLLHHLVHRCRRLDPGLIQDAQRFLLVRTREAYDEWHADLDPSCRLDDAIRHVIAPRDTTENVEADHLHVRIARDDAERVRGLPRIR